MKEVGSVVLVICYDERQWIQEEKTMDNKSIFGRNLRANKSGNNQVLKMMVFFVIIYGNKKYIP